MSMSTSMSRLPQEIIDLIIDQLICITTKKGFLFSCSNCLLLCSSNTIPLIPVSMSKFLIALKRTLKIGIISTQFCFNHLSSNSMFKKFLSPTFFINNPSATSHIYCVHSTPTFLTSNMSWQPKSHKISHLSSIFPMLTCLRAIQLNYGPNFSRDWQHIVTTRDCQNVITMFSFW